MRCIAISDENSLVGQLDGTADILLCLGDLWDSAIAKAMSTYQCERVFAVKGNHDSNQCFAPGVIDLHLRVEEWGGLRFGGFKGCWKYKPRGHHLFSQHDVTEALRTFPAVDVFIAHNSPAGFHERDDDVHRGFSAFAEYIERTQPSYFFHGHQHIRQISQLGNTSVIGVYGEMELELAADEAAPAPVFAPFDFDDE